MLHNRFLYIMVSVALLVIAALVIFQTQAIASLVFGSRNLSGEYAPAGWETGHTYAGTGDPDRFPNRLSLPEQPDAEDGHTYAGTGDPDRFMNRNKISNPAEYGGHTYRGTGDPGYLQGRSIRP